MSRKTQFKFAKKVFSESITDDFYSKCDAMAMQAKTNPAKAISNFGLILAEKETCLKFLNVAASLINDSNDKVAAAQISIVNFTNELLRTQGNQCDPFDVVLERCEATGIKKAIQYLKQWVETQQAKAA